MERTEIFNKLKDIISKGMDNYDDILAKATEDSNLKTDLNLNSIGMLYLVISMEEAFNIRFDDVSLNDFEKVSNVIDYIAEKLK